MGIHKPGQDREVGWGSITSPLQCYTQPSLDLSPRAQYRLGLLILSLFTMQISKSFMCWEPRVSISSCVPHCPVVTPHALPLFGVVIKLGWLVPPHSFRGPVPSGILHLFIDITNIFTFVC